MLYRFPDAFVQAAHNWKLSMQTIATLGKPKKCMYIQYIPLALRKENFFFYFLIFLFLHLLFIRTGIIIFFVL